MDPNGDETLDNLITGTSSVPTTQAVDSLHEHLSYPSLDTEDDSSRRESSSQSQPLPLFKDRIYVGNLHPSVDEYTLVQVFSKFGKITSVDYLFHKSGPLKGKPRGYAFLKYADENEAQKAMSVAHDKLLRGRKIVVTYAHHAPLDSANSKSRRAMMEIGRPTTLSLLKSGPLRPLGTATKIAQMEAKLRQLESSTESTLQSSRPLHPSLPLKPQSGPVEPQSGLAQRGLKSKSIKGSWSVQPDELPPSLLKFKTPSALASPTLSSAAAKLSNRPKVKLLGVKIKPKDKDKPTTATPALKSDS